MIFRKTLFFTLLGGLFLSVLVLLRTIAYGQGQPIARAGAPEVSFRYQQAYGEAQKPYLDDATHLNRPYGLFIDSADAIYVVEEEGARLLKYDLKNQAQHLLTVGAAGVRLNDSYEPDTDAAYLRFITTRDVTTDGANNLWVADGNRIMKLQADGRFQLQLPAQNPWEGGQDNQHFNQVRGVAFAAPNWLFVSDRDNQRIQVYDISSGALVYTTTIGVTGEEGEDNNHFRNPRHIAIDSKNRLYVADTGNNRVQRCILNNGQWGCSTFAADLNQPYGVAVDQNDTVYIADTANGRVVKCTSNGACTPLATDLNWPYDLAVDSQGNLYAAATYDYHVYKITPAGQVQASFLGQKGVPYLTDNAHYNHPYVAVDGSGNLLISEEQGHRLLKLNPDGGVIWSAGEAGVNSSTDDHFNYPRGVAVDKTGQIYVVDDDHHIQVLTSEGHAIKTIGTGYGGENNQFRHPTHLAFDQQGRLYVSDEWNHRVQIFDAAGSYLASLGVTDEPGNDNTHFNYPRDVVIDKAGNIYVADAGNCRVQKFDSNRVYLQTIGTGSCGDELNEIYPQALALDVQGWLYVADGWAARIKVFDSEGRFITIIANGWSTDPGSFTGYISSLAIDSAGNLYAADYEGARIQKFSLGVPGWQQASINGFGYHSEQAVSSLESFQGQLYAGTSNYERGASIWRSADGRAWQRVTQPGFGVASPTTNPVLADLIEFKAQLYASVGQWWDDDDGAQIWRSPNGEAWQQVVFDGFGNRQNTNIVNLGIYNDRLYASTYNGQEGVEIWRTATGNPGEWEKVVNQSFGLGGRYYSISDLQGWNGFLYAGLETNNEQNERGAQLWRSPNGITWTQVISDGFSNLNNTQTGSMAIFQNMLYLGTANDESGGSIVRSNDGLHWTTVISNGFGDGSNIKVQSLYVFNNTLYAATYNWSTGVEVWRTTNGQDWQQINPDGFGMPKNFSTLLSNATVNFNNALYYGVENEFAAGSIWQLIANAPPTPTPTVTPTVTPTSTGTPNAARTPTATSTSLSAGSQTRYTYLPSIMKVATPTPTLTPTASPTPSPSPTLTASPTPIPPEWRFVGGDGQPFAAISVQKGFLYLAETKNGLYRHNNCNTNQAFTSVQNGLQAYDLDFNGSIGLAATYDKGLYRSSNGGDSWQAVSIPALTPDLNRWYAVSFARTDAGVRLYAGTAKDGLYTSQDDGLTWSKLAGGPKYINRLVQQGNFLWVLAGEDLEGRREGLWRLDLANNSFSQFNTGLVGSALESWDLAVNSNTLYLASKDGIYQSQAGGAWTSLGIKGIKVRSLELSNGSLYAGTDINSVWSARLATPTVWNEVKLGAGWANNLTVRDLVFDATLCQGLVAATSDGIWVLK